MKGYGWRCAAVFAGGGERDVIREIGLARS